jgi:hypothetical protein
MPADIHHFDPTGDLITPFKDLYYDWRQPLFTHALGKVPHFNFDLAQDICQQVWMRSGGSLPKGPTEPSRRVFWSIVPIPASKTVAADPHGCLSSTRNSTMFPAKPWPQRTIQLFSHPVFPLKCLRICRRAGSAVDEAPGMTELVPSGDTWSEVVHIPPGTPILTFPSRHAKNVARA